MMVGGVYVGLDPPPTGTCIMVGGQVVYVGLDPPPTGMIVGGVSAKHTRKSIHTPT